MSTAISNSQSPSPAFRQQSSMVNFIVEGQVIPFEVRFLLPCDYFNTLLNSGMKESQSGNIEVKEVSLEIFKIFLEYLKNGSLPILNFDQTVELFELAHQYEHRSLLNLTKAELTKAIPTHLPELLSLACLYDWKEMKTACQTHLKRNSYQFRDLLFQLIESEDSEAVTEVLKWNQDVLYEMMTYQDANRQGIFLKLISKQWLSLAAKFLNAGTSIGMSQSHLIDKPQEAIYELLNQKGPLSAEQNDLICAIVGNNSYMLTQQNYPQEDPPLHYALRRGLNETFVKMLALCNQNVALATNSKGQTLLSLAISLKRISLIKALRERCQRVKGSLSSSFSSYVLEGIQTSQPAIVQEIVAFPGDRYNSRIDMRCIEAAIEKGVLKILEIIWPHFETTDYDLAQLRMQTFKSNRLDLAPIIFSNNFDASRNIYPGSEQELKQSLPWIHYIALKGSLEWVSFMIPKCSNINVQVEIQCAEYPKQGQPTTPLLTALLKLRDPPIIQAFLDSSADVNLGNEVLSPIHA
ncbi:MAG TPA: BTB/POZ domain-containing protein, partial [Candidatus Babeliaceae bacterium]|nr:BTB/POZ domain-containing protein [Candidatus Babeliaceae bacterium]